LLCVVLAGFLIPDAQRIPVAGASAKDWNAASFWYEAWGLSGVHKGIDIFAKQGTPVLASSSGVVVFQGTLGMGGHVVAVLSSQWRIHYYAHMAHDEPVPRFVASGAALGRVGTSGNAAGKPAHLHYSVCSLIPLPWRIDSSPQGWKKCFFLNPHELLQR
jgi:peptidoglycan LD-endopeptidase LytH